MTRLVRTLDAARTRATRTVGTWGVFAAAAEAAPVQVLWILPAETSAEADAETDEAGRDANGREEAARRRDETVA